MYNGKARQGEARREVIGKGGGATGSDDGVGGGEVTSLEGGA